MQPEKESSTGVYDGSKNAQCLSKTSLFKGFYDDFYYIWTLLHIYNIAYVTFVLRWQSCNQEFGSPTATDVSLSKKLTICLLCYCKNTDRQESNYLQHVPLVSFFLFLSPTFCTSKLQCFPECYRRCSLHGNTQLPSFSIKIMGPFFAHPFTLKIN